MGSNRRGELGSSCFSCWFCIISDIKLNLTLCTCRDAFLCYRYSAGATRLFFEDVRELRPTFLIGTPNVSPYSSHSRTCNVHCSVHPVTKHRINVALDFASRCLRVNFERSQRSSLVKLDRGSGGYRKHEWTKARSCPRQLLIGGLGSNKSDVLPSAKHGLASYS